MWTKALHNSSQTPRLIDGGMSDVDRWPGSGSSLTAGVDGVRPAGQISEQHAAHLRHHPCHVLSFGVVGWTDV